MGQVERIAIAVMLVSVAILGMSSFYTESGESFGTGSQDIEYMNRANQTLDQIEAIQEQTETATSQGILGIGLAIVEGGISSLKLLFGMVGTTGDMINAFGAELGLGAYVLYIGGIVIIMIVLGILKSVVRWDI